MSATKKPKQPVYRLEDINFRNISTAENDTETAWNNTFDYYYERPGGFTVVAAKIAYILGAYFLVENFTAFINYAYYTKDIGFLLPVTENLEVLQYARGLTILATTYPTLCGIVRIITILGYCCTIPPHFPIFFSLLETSARTRTFEFKLQVSRAYHSATDASKLMV